MPEIIVGKVKRKEEKDMQSQFTDKAQEALNHASKYAGRLKQGYVGTEHILAGLLREPEGVAHKVLADNGVELSQVLDMIQELIAFDGGVGLKDRGAILPGRGKFWRRPTDRRPDLDRRRREPSIF